MERMLVALDGSENAEQILPYVEELGKKMDLPATLLRVCLPGETKDKQYLAKLVKSLVGRGVDARAHTIEAVSKPKIAGSILDYAINNDILLICLVTHARGGITKQICGATAKEILSTSSIPVMILRTRAAGPMVNSTTIPDGVLVPLDGSKLAEKAIPWAEKLARRMRGQVILFRVGEVIFDIMPMGKKFVSPREEEGQARSEATRYVTRMADEFRARRRAKVRAEIQLGWPPEAICQRAGQSDIGLIVMSTHGRTGLMRIIFGSVTGHVLSNSPMPVVVVRPQ